MAHTATKFFFSQMSIMVATAMMIAWITKYKGGFSQDVPTFPWNLHPLFMTLAFVFCSGEAIVAYSIWPFHHRYKKFLHAGFHTISLLFAVIGIWATFQYHHNANLPHLFSLHSWFGLLAISLFIAQWMFGLFYYMFQIPSLYWRATMLPVHRFSGGIVFIFAVMVAVTGLVQSQTSSHAAGESLYSGVTIFANFTALAFLTCVATVLGIVFLSVVEENKDEYSAILTENTEYSEALSSSM